MTTVMGKRPKATESQLTPEDLRRLDEIDNEYDKRLSEAFNKVARDFETIIQQQWIDDLKEHPD